MTANQTSFRYYNWSQRDAKTELRIIGFANEIQKSTDAVNVFLILLLFIYSTRRKYKVTVLPRRSFINI